jgi:hypothetical protein
MHELLQRTRTTCACRKLDHCTVCVAAYKCPSTFQRIGISKIRLKTPLYVHRHDSKTIITQIKRYGNTAS